MCMRIQIQLLIWIQGFDEQKLYYFTAEKKNFFHKKLQIIHP